MKIASLAWWAPLFIVLATVGCEVENDNETKCVAKDCTASCVEAGRQSGTCIGAGRCNCIGGTPISYEWGPFDTGSDELRSTDTQIGIDSGDTDAMIPSDPGGDAGDTVADGG